MNSEGQTERQSESKEGSKSRSGKRWSVVEPKSCYPSLSTVVVTARQRLVLSTRKANIVALAGCGEFYRRDT